MSSVLVLLRDGLQSLPFRFHPFRADLDLRVLGFEFNQLSFEPTPSLSIQAGSLPRLNIKPVGLTGYDGQTSLYVFSFGVKLMVLSSLLPESTPRVYGLGSALQFTADIQTPYPCTHSKNMTFLPHKECTKIASLSG